jgi:hypothetical protein
MTTFDWQSDEATQEIVGAWLHEQRLDCILDDHYLLCDPTGAAGALFYPSLADAGEHSIKITIHVNLRDVIDRIAEYIHKKDYSDSLRHMLVHGLAIYLHDTGKDIETAYESNSESILEGDPGVMANIQFECKVPYPSRPASCRIDGHLFRLIHAYSIHSGICQREFCGYLVALSLITHPKLQHTRNHDTLSNIIDETEIRLRMRINTLKS